MAADERIDSLCPMLSKNYDQDYPNLFLARERLMELVGQMVSAPDRPGSCAPMWSPAI